MGSAAKRDTAEGKSSAEGRAKSKTLPSRVLPPFCLHGLTNIKTADHDPNTVIVKVLEPVALS